MWLTKPLYEVLPYAYMVLGTVSLIASIYVNYWHWPMIATVVGIGCLIAGLVVWLRRRDYRHSRNRKMDIGDGVSD